MIVSIKQFFNTGHPRSLVAKRNILGSLLIKGSSMLLSLFLVPLTLSILDSTKYGIWITLFSIVSWFNMMDIGLGNGFRNRFSEAISKNQIDEARNLISFLYSFMSVAFVIFVTIIFSLQPFLNWAKILNLSEAFDENINNIVFIAFLLFGLQLITKNISYVLLALQKTALNDLLGFVCNIIIFITIYSLKNIINGKLTIIVLIFMLTPVVVNIFSTFLLFQSRLKSFIPSKIIFNKVYFHRTMNIGIQFFIIQVAGLVLFSTSNVMITQLWEPSDVTPYNIAYRLFNSFMVIFTIIVTPFWTAWTEAYAKEDFAWIKKSINNLIKAWGLFSIMIFSTLFLSPFIYSVWIGDKISIPMGLSVQFSIYTLVLSFSSIPSFFLAGIGQIKVALWIAIGQTCIYIPMVLLLNNLFNWGTISVILSLNIVLIIGAIILTLHSNKILDALSAKKIIIYP